MSADGGKPIRVLVKNASCSKVNGAVRERFGTAGQLRAHRGLWVAVRNRTDNLVETVCSALGVEPAW